jgi:uridylate kinase
MLKLSGEVLAGTSGAGLDPKILDEIAIELAEALEQGARAAIVLGGGNIFRGLGAAAKGMDRVAADQMGMLATVINGLALKDAVLRAGGGAELFSSFSVGPVAALYVRDSALEAMKNGALAILTGGTGNPYFSTDSAAALRAAELGCAVLYKGTKVDGVYDGDPRSNPDAKRFESLGIDELIAKRLGIMDLTAATLCRENNIDIRVYKMTDKGSIRDAALGKPLGTLVFSGSPP